MLKLKESAPDEHIHPTAFRLVGHPVDTSLEVRLNEAVEAADATRDGNRTF